MIRQAVHFLRKKMHRTMDQEMKAHPQLITLGQGSFFSEHATLDCRSNADTPRIEVGKDCLLECNFILEAGESKIKIGNRTYINAGTNLIARSGITIGDDVTIAWGVYLYDHDSHSLDWRERRKDMAFELAKYRSGETFLTGRDWSSIRTAPITIGNKVWIGMNAIILKGVTIGEGVIIGAGSVVTMSPPPWTVVAGNPARVVKRLTPAEGAELE